MRILISHKANEPHGNDMLDSNNGITNKKVNSNYKCGHENSPPPPLLFYFFPFSEEVTDIMGSKVVITTITIVINNNVTVLRVFRNSVIEQLLATLDIK